MKNQDFLPAAKVYELEMRYFPWGKLVAKVLDHIVQNAPQGASVVDLMCGPGHLLGALRKKRPDLKLTGVDCNAKYIRHARRSYQKVEFICADARTWNPGKKFSIVVCTAGVHHLPYRDQPSFIRTLPSLVTAEGKVILADPFIAPYTTERERKRNAAAFGHATLQAVLEKNPPAEIIQAAIDVLRNDVLGWECKTSFAKIVPVLERHFRSIQISYTWKPELEEDAGDCLFLLQV